MSTSTQTQALPARSPIGARIQFATARYGVRIALHEVRDGVTRVVTYAELGRRVRDLEVDLETSDVPRGTCVVIVGAGPEAIVAELGVIAAGRIAVPVPELNGPNLAHLAAAGVRPAAVLAAIPPGPPGGAPRVGRPSTGADAADYAITQALNDVPWLPLTAPPRPRRRLARGSRRATAGSGGGPSNRTRNESAPWPAAGDPALVLPNATFTHGQLAAGLDALTALLPVRAGRRHVTHLPHAPAARRAFTWHALFGGAEHCHLWRADELDVTGARVLVADAEDIVAVAGRHPLLREAAADLPNTAPEQGPGGSAGLLRRVRGQARRTARAVQRARAAGGRVPVLAGAGHGILEATLLAPARAALGRPAIAIACGDAAMPAQVLDAFFAAGLPIYQAWTPAQAFGPVTCNTPTRLRFGTLGTPLDGIGMTTGVETAVAEGPWLRESLPLPGAQDTDGYLVPTATLPAPA